MVAVRATIAVVACWLASMAAPAAAMAQDAGIIVLNADQERLNTEGFQAAIDGEFERAVGLFQASLHQGEANITYLNLGRALSRLGRCDEAVEAFAKTPTAPQVATPTAPEIAEIQTKFEAELREVCPGKLIIHCEPLEMRVRIDNESAVTCPAAPVEVSAGPHTVVGFILDEKVAEQVDIVGLETTEVTLTIARDEVPEPEPLPPPVEEEGSGLAIAGWVSIGVGLAALGAGAIYGATVLDPDFDDYRAAGAAGESEAYAAARDSVSTGQSVVLGLWIGGGVATAMGVTLVAVHYATAANDAEAASTLSPMVLHDGAGLAWSALW